MNQQEVDKHIKFQIILIIMTIFCFLCFLIYIIAEPVSAASDYHNVVTSAVYTGTTHCTTNQNGLCVANTSSTTYGRYTFGTTDYSNALAINFTLNTAVRANVNATIRLTGSNWANVSYVCMSSHFSCRVVRASSTILNINFSNTGTSNVTGAEFFINTNSGSILNTNSTFYVQKADLYETIITTPSESGSSSNTDIINNQNQNTQDIINSQNENAEDIITNANQNTQDILAGVSGAVDSVTGQLADTRDLIGSGCLIGPTNFDVDTYHFETGSIDENGNVNSSNTSYRASPFLKIQVGHPYEINVGQSRTVPYFCWYYGNKGKISCTAYNNTRIFTVTPPANAVYLRVTSIGSGGQFIPVKIMGPICNEWSLEEQQNINNSINETNNYLKDDSNPTINNSGIDSALSSVEIDDPLNYLLTLPISLLQKLNTVLSSNSCQRVSFGSLYNTELYLPCINFSELLGTNIWNTIDLFVGVGLLAVILKRFYESISNILTMGKEKEVKDKLDLPTPMEFLASILGGGKD